MRVAQSLHVPVKSSDSRHLPVTLNFFSEQLSYTDCASAHLSDQLRFTWDILDRKKANFGALAAKFVLKQMFTIVTFLTHKNERVKNKEPVPDFLEGSLSMTVGMKCI